MVQSANMLVLVMVYLYLLSTTKAITQQTETWNKKVLYKATANLTCQNAEFDPLEHQGAQYQWLLPSGNVIRSSVLTHLDDRYSFINNGSTLLIRDIEKYDFGVYFCLVTTDYQPSVFRAIKLGVNIDGPYFGDLWQRYQQNLRNGLLASIVTFVVMSMFCYNHNQYQSRHDKPTSIDISLKTLPDVNNLAHSNSAYVPDNMERTEDDHPNKEVTDVEPKTKF